MKILTIRQPYVAAIFAGLKTFETRGKPTTYRGPLGIHSAARPYLPTRGGVIVGADQLMRTADPRSVVPGCIIGMVELVGCVHAEDVPKRQRVWGDFSPGRWAWQVENQRLLPTPI